MSFLQLPAEPMFQPYDHDPTSVSPQDYQGIALMGRSMSFSGMERCGELIARDGGEDEMSDEGVVGIGEKKRRLNLEQVKALEKSFELGNKLEPERKMQLARALGLQPRQIAIWFQNRRARWKTKQLQRDYDILKTQFDALKSDNHSLKSLNNKLHRQLLVLKGRESGSDENRTINLNKQTHQGTSCWSNGSENSCDRVNPTGGLFLQISSSATTPDLILQSHHQRMNPDETLCSMFNGLDDHPPGFWPWPPHHHHQNFHG